MAFITAVFSYSSIGDILARLPKEYQTNIQNPRQRIQLEEIDRILSRENVRTAVGEEYLDRHFIHDFCGHYGSCFYDYPKKCIRLHFFTREFSEEQFKSLITSDEATSYDLGDYIGFIVLRPIPGAILSNVSLKADVNAPDSFLITKERSVHLCGLDLYVDTIPFQEQDHAISACATAALWMALQAVPGTQPHNVPSPHKLTENAHKIMVEGVKSHEVSRGLTVAQMSGAIKEENLNPLTCVPLSTSYSKALIKAYLNMDVPVMLGIELYFRSDKAAKNVSSRRLGFHSVTALGYELGAPIKPFDSPDMASKEKGVINDLFLEASSISKLFCHDDQIGPYATMAFSDEYCIGLDTEWGRMFSYGPVDAKIISVLVPCNPKVRIRFSKIYEIVKALNADFSGHFSLFGGETSWDIRLENVCNVKRQLRSAFSLDESTRFDLLSMSMPRYLWVVDQYYRVNNRKDVITSFLFDATDIENSNFLIRIIHYNNFSFTTTHYVANLPLSSASQQSSPEIVRHMMDLYRMRDNEGNPKIDKKIIFSM